MASRTPAPEKRPGFFATIKQLFTFVHKEYSWVAWGLPIVILLGVWVGVVVAIVTDQQWWGYILWVIFGIMLGLIASMLLLNRLATTAMYRQIDGMPGAGGHVVSNMLGRKWRGEEMPVAVNPKSQDAVYRAVGRGGVVLVGEGAPSRLDRLVKKEKATALRITHSSVPVNVFYVGHDEGQVEIKNLAKAIKKLPNAVDRAGMNQLISRSESMSRGGAAAMPIPKGIDPLRVRAPRPR
ncbi:DUF4191 family protein [Microbacterium indicum]|uniref:DUF4191 family protein n=1 Tax=Microbacterium indicum TaxID=358100 RepID=UPI0004254C2F|nr:DUF4191 family protein [Microbacterium indicum]